MTHEEQGIQENQIHNNDENKYTSVRATHIGSGKFILTLIHHAGFEGQDHETRLEGWCGVIWVNDPKSKMLRGMVGGIVFPYGMIQEWRYIATDYEMTQKNAETLGSVDEIEDTWAQSLDKSTKLEPEISHGNGQ